MFFLIYGGMHLSETEILSWPREKRAWYMNRLRDQLEQESARAKR